MDIKTAAFLGALYTGTAYGNYWRLQDKQVQWFPASAIPDSLLGSQNVYMSVHGCRAPRGQYERTRTEDVQCINHLFAEFDTKDFADDTAVREHIRALPTQPQVIVASGGGYHCYWFVAEPMPVTPDGMVYLAGIQSAWVRMVGADPGAKDMARVLRLPGTMNHKYSPARRVLFVRFDLVTKTRYKFADLCAVAEPFWQEEPTAQAAIAEPTIEHGQKTGAIAAIVDTLRKAPEGQRNKLLHWAACKMYEKGMSVASVQAELLHVAVSIGLAEKESIATISSAAKQPARPQEPYTPQTRMPSRSKSLDSAIENVSRKYQQ